MMFASKFLSGFSKNFTNAPKNCSKRVKSAQNYLKKLLTLT